MKDFTLIIPYYRNPHMLATHLHIAALYPPGVRIIVVDDGSPEPALPIVEKSLSFDIGPDVRLYRIGVDIPWNREGARNLGASVCETDWLVHVDIDHVMPVDAARALLEFEPNSKHAYRFPRWRRGRADATRRKDKLPDDCEFGQIHPHVDSYLVSKARYWKAGGYDEDFSGTLGGGNEFLKRLECHAGKFQLLPEPIRLEVCTRTAVPDASDLHCSRDTSKGKAIWRRKQLTRPASQGPKTHMRFPWERLL